MTDNDFREPTGMYNIPAITAQISKNAQEARRKNLNKQIAEETSQLANNAQQNQQTANRDYRTEAGKIAATENANNIRRNTANGVNDVGLTRQQNQIEIPDREVSDERCKEMRRKSIEKMKKGWGETDVMKKKKKEEEQKKK